MELQSKIQILSKLLGKEIDNVIFKNIINKCIKKEACHPSNSKQIFVSLQINKEIDEGTKRNMLEQLETAFQILINKGYRIFASYSSEDNKDLCRNFVEVFKDKSIAYVENNRENQEIISVMQKSEFIVAMDEGSLLYSLTLEKPFIALFENKALLEELHLQALFADLEGFHAGRLLERIQYLEENKESIKKHILNEFNEFGKELISRKHDASDMQKEWYNDDQVKETNDKKNTDEMELYKKQFKDKLQSLIEKGLFFETKTMINEYEEIIKDDIDIFSIKGVAAMMEGHMEDAEEIFKSGLAIDKRNFDLLYNMAYLYQLNQKNELAIVFYKKALKNAKDASHANEVYEILEKLGVKEDAGKMVKTNKNSANSLDDIKFYKEKLQGTIQEYLKGRSPKAD